MASSNKKDLRTVIDLREKDDKALWTYVNDHAEKEHRTVAKQVRHMLGIAVYHATMCNGRKSSG